MKSTEFRAVYDGRGTYHHWFRILHKTPEGEEFKYVVTLPHENLISKGNGPVCTCPAGTFKAGGRKQKDCKHVVACLEFFKKTEEPKMKVSNNIKELNEKIQELESNIKRLELNFDIYKEGDWWQNNLIKRAVRRMIWILVATFGAGLLLINIIGNTLVFQELFGSVGMILLALICVVILLITFFYAVDG